MKSFKQFVRWLVLLLKGERGDWRESVKAELSKTAPFGLFSENPFEYNPDAETDALSTPVKNPVLAFHEALRDPDPAKRPKVSEAWLFEGRFDEHGKLLRDKKALESLNGAWPRAYRIRHVRSDSDFRTLSESAIAAWNELPAQAQRARESVRLKRQALKRLKEAHLVEDGLDFELGYDGYGTYDIGQYTEWVSALGGPFAKQLYIADYLRMHGLAFEAWNHNPIAKRIIELISQYAFGRRFKVRIKDAQKEQAWKDFDETHRIREKVSTFWIREFCLYGEIMINVETWQLIDPSTVWDIVTDPDNLDDVYYYHQQYSTAYQQFVNSGLGVKSTEYIIRQIPAEKVLHIKGNCVSNEKRGRSVLFPILGWLKRIKDLYNAQVIRQWLASCFIWDDTVQGSPAEVAAHASSYASMPRPGSVFAHNAAIERKPMPAVDSGTVSAATQTGQEIISFIATSVGIPKEFFNVTSAGGGSRAQALTSAEPFTKVIEDVQAKFEALLLRVAKIAFEQEGLTYEEGDVEFLFPSVTKDTTTETLKNIALAESMGWLSKRSCGEMAGGELNVTSYNFDDEQDKITDEAETNMNQVGSTPPPPGGRFGKLEPGEGETEIHGNGKVKLEDELKTL